MLKFQPERQLTLAPNDKQQLQTSLTLINPTHQHATFKIKATKPALFVVEPPIGILRPQRSITVVIRTRSSLNSQAAQEISYHNRFLVEFAMVDRVPDSPEQAVKLITEENCLTHKLFLASGRTSQTHDREDVSNHYSYRTVQEDEDLVASRSHPEKGKYEGMTEDQKADYLTRELERLEKEKTELVMTGIPRGSSSLVKIILVFLMAIIVGNLLGRSLGLKREKKVVVRQKQFDWFGMAHYWRGKQEEQHQEDESWWDF